MLTDIQHQDNVKKKLHIFPKWDIFPHTNKTRFPVLYSRTKGFTSSLFVSAVWQWLLCLLLLNMHTNEKL